MNDNSVSETCVNTASVGVFAVGDSKAPGEMTCRTSETLIVSFRWFIKQTECTSMQIIQPTRCNNFSSLLLDVYLQHNVFRASSRLSPGAQQLQ
jgi:hypothetical protein